MKRTTHLLIETETYVQTAQMTYDYYKECEKYGDLECRITLTKKITSRDIEWADIIMSIRSTNILSTYISGLCKKYGRIHVLLLDDNLFIHARTDYFMKIRQRELRDILNLTNVAFVCNTLLAERLNADFNVQRFVKLDTAVNSTSINYIKDTGKVDTKNKNSYRVVYYSNDGGVTYFKNVLENVLKKLDMEITFKIFIDCIGMNEIETHLNHIQIRNIPHLSLQDFRKYLAREKFDFGIAPLPFKDGFSEYKYFNKFIEFSMAGIPGIYSDCPPYSFVIKNGINGVLCSNTEDAWTCSILQMINNNGLRKKIIENAQHQLDKEFSNSGIYSKFKEQFPEIVVYRAPIVKVNNFMIFKIKFMLFVIMEKINSVYRYLRKGGISAVLVRTKYYFMVFGQINKARK